MFSITPYEEGVTPGFCVFDVPEAGRFGIVIYYRLWFPAIARTLTSLGAEVILNPVLTRFVDRDAGPLIARAPAAVFQSYAVHINGLGAGGNAGRRAGRAADTSGGRRRGTDRPAPSDRFSDAGGGFSDLRIRAFSG
jgi:predicted amidohydrolase